MTSKSIAPFEIGSFTASTPQKTEFIGSASGVFFVNTVFRAFAKSAANHSKTTPSASGVGSNNDQNSLLHDPGSVDSRLVDPDTPVQIDQENTGMRIHIENDETGQISGPQHSYGITGHGLGSAPTQDSARHLLMLYLKNWHPLFPFLHGPTLLQTISELYVSDAPHERRSRNLRTRLCHAVICQCIFNIAALDANGNDPPLPVECQLESPTKLISLLGYIASNHDTLSLQALVAAQLYLVTTMSLRAASTIGGTLTRVMFHAGFHRCPFRYALLPRQDCDLRKRIFWSAYVLDRYLSQALGHPLGIQDADLDVCIPGMDELHKPVSATRLRTTPTNSDSNDNVLAHLPRGHDGQRARSQEGPAANSKQPENDDPASTCQSAHADASAEPATTESNSRGSQILGHYVLYCRLTGQALEMFHISLQNRTINAEGMLELQSNVHAWWNGLPQELQEEYNGGKMDLTSAFSFFFSILYNHLLLLTNRPFLSLPPKTLEFRSSLQTCVSASRQIITTARRQSERIRIISWPGVLSATWMAGLVLSFACTLRLYPFHKARREIEDSIQALLAMRRPWNNAKHCAEALRSLIDNLETQYNEKPKRQTSTPSFSAMTQSELPAGTNGGDIETVAPDYPEELSRKRKRRQSQQKRTEQNVPESAGDRPRQHQHRSDSGSNQDFNADSYQMPSFDNVAMFPMLEYTVPDIGFDSDQLTNVDDFGYLGLPVSDDLYTNNPGAFGNIGWEAMANGTGNMQGWPGWSGARP